MALRTYEFRLMAPEPGDTGGGDRGDDFVPTDDDTPETVSKETVEVVKKLAADVAAEKLETEVEKEKEAEPEHKKDTRIPLARHKEILEKEREQRTTLEAKLAQYEKGGQLADMNAELTAAENEILKMDKEYNALLADGELDKAADLMSKIRKTERDMAEAKSDMKIHAAEIRATERARYNVALERIEGSFPMLNPDHADYDGALMTEVAELKDAYQTRGHTPTVALQKAVRALVETRTTRQEIATTSAPRVDAKDVAAERKAGAVEKTTAAVAKTPALLNEVGRDSDKLGGGKLDAKEAIKLSQKEFAKLSEADLALMRGDEI